MAWKASSFVETTEHNVVGKECGTQSFRRALQSACQHHGELVAIW